MCGLPWRPSPCGVPEASNVWKGVKGVTKALSLFFSPFLLGMHGLGTLGTLWRGMAC